MLDTTDFVVYNRVSHRSGQPNEMYVYICNRLEMKKKKHVFFENICDTVPQILYLAPSSQ